MNQNAKLFDAHEGNEPEIPPCWMTAAARKKLNQGESWHWCKAEVIGDDLLLEGGIPDVFVKGKRAGRHKWAGIALTKCVITRADTDLARSEYEEATGKCCECAGTGQRQKGWHHQTGKSFESCGRCQATGKPPEVRP
jgi:hypothetical protein